MALTYNEDFLDRTQKAWTKKEKLILYQITNFDISKTLLIMKRQATDWNKY